MARARRQAGFIPGVVIEINIRLAVLGVIVAVLVSWSSFALKPVSLDSRLPALVEVAADAGAPLPADWAVARKPDGATVIVREEPVIQRWIVPVLLIATVVSMFVWHYRYAFRVMLVILCATWGYAIHAGPLTQGVAMGAEAVTLYGSPRFTGFIRPAETVAAKDLDRVLVHKENAELYVVFRKHGTKYGWRVYADTPQAARALAARLQAELRLPVAGKPAVFAPAK